MSLKTWGFALGCALLASTVMAAYTSANAAPMISAKGNDVVSVGDNTCMKTMAMALTVTNDDGTAYYGTTVTRVRHQLVDGKFGCQVELIGASSWVYVFGNEDGIVRAQTEDVRMSWASTRPDPVLTGPWAKPKAAAKKPAAPKAVQASPAAQAIASAVKPKLAAASPLDSNAKLDGMSFEEKYPEPPRKSAAK